ncbi:MAG: M15 family metallopeptidase [Bacteroidetes bacterium]|nr:M15 family metallopeptidase [Bacteroidota bacterium]
MIFENRNIYRQFNTRLLGLCLLAVMAISCTETEKKEAAIHLDSTADSTETETGYSDMERAMINQGLKDIQQIVPDIMVDLKYSSSDNFFKTDAYGDTHRAFLQEKPATALKVAQYLLKKKNPNYTLLIYDAARPLSVQKVMWESLDTIPSRNRKNYVADPNIGSIHNYGCAVDLSIFDLSTQKELDMGTPFDYFGDLAYPRKEKQLLENGKLSVIQVMNRRLLREIMLTAGYDPTTSEWWHFNFYPLARAKKNYRLIE